MGLDDNVRDDERISELNRVRSLAETARIVNISIITLRRVIANGTGPRVTRISRRRVGVTDRNRELWIDQCSGVQANGAKHR